MTYQDKMIFKNPLALFHIFTNFTFVHTKVTSCVSKNPNMALTMVSLIPWGCSMDAKILISAKSNVKDCDSTVWNKVVKFSNGC